MPSSPIIKLNSAAYPRTGKRGVPQQFPRRLYEMLQCESTIPQSPGRHGALISWSDSGRAFRIGDISLFSTLVLPKYFRTSKFSSFQRNLNLYGFSKVRRGPDTDMYAHPAFRRGGYELLSQLRKCTNGTEKKRGSKTSVVHEGKNTKKVDDSIDIFPEGRASFVASHTSRLVSPCSSKDEVRHDKTLNPFPAPPLQNEIWLQRVQQHKSNQWQKDSANYDQAIININPYPTIYQAPLEGRQTRNEVIKPVVPRPGTGKLALLAIAMTSLAEQDDLVEDSTTPPVQHQI